MAQQGAISAPSGGVTPTSSKSAARVRGTSRWGRAWKKFKRNKMAMAGAILAIFLTLVAIFAPWVAPYSYSQSHWDHAWEPPNWKFPFGTDELGRDMLSRQIWALRNALTIAVLAEVVTLMVGSAIGATAGYFGGKIDNILMRFTDIMFAFPSLLFNIVLVAVLGRGLLVIFIAIGVTRWTGLARLVRGQVLALKQMEYVQAAKASGASGWDIILHYLLPNAAGPIIVTLALGIPANMMVESALSLIGMGVAPPMPSWGALISTYQNAFRAYPHLLLFPAGTFAITLLAFTYLGDGLSEAMDPKD